MKDERDNIKKILLAELELARQKLLNKKPIGYEEQVKEYDKAIKYEKINLYKPPYYIRRLTDFGFIFQPSRLDLANTYHKNILAAGTVEIYSFMLRTGRGVMKWEIQNNMWNAHKDPLKASSLKLDRGIDYMTNNKPLYARIIAESNKWDDLMEHGILNQFNIPGSKEPALVVQKSLHALNYSHLRKKNKAYGKLMVEALKNFSEITDLENREPIPYYYEMEEGEVFQYEITLPYHGKIMFADDTGKHETNGVFYGKDIAKGDMKRISVEEALDIINKQGGEKINEYLAKRERIKKILVY